MLSLKIHDNISIADSAGYEQTTLEAGLDEEIAYTKELLQVLEEGVKSCGNKKIQKLSHEMKELLEDERLKEIRSKDDKDARFGHKTATSTFYGYKNHLAMTEERLIAGITVTDGGKWNKSYRSYRRYGICQ